MKEIDICFAVLTIALIICLLIFFGIIIHMYLEYKDDANSYHFYKSRINKRRKK